MPRLAVGTIVIWAGSVATIPPGWHLCDGNEGTPDLRDRFVVCTGPLFGLGATGGTSTHVHTVTTNGHFHTLPAGSGFKAGTEMRDFSNTVAPSGNTNSQNHLPPWYALAYIMRI